MRNFVEEVQNKYSFINNLLTNSWKSWNKSHLKYKYRLQNIEWKNSKAKPGYAYSPTEIEKLANVLTHGIWIIPAILACLKLFERSQTACQYLVSWVYGGTLVMLFTVSTFFHLSCYYNHKSLYKTILHRCDRAMIYVFIAGSYYPWLQLAKPTQSFVFICMEWIIWVFAGVGITYQQMFHERYKCLETCFYILMGLAPAFIVLLSGHEFNGLSELKLGGLLYILGIYFFKSDGFIPLAHSIWHLFVVLAAACHYYAILFYLYP